MYCSQCGKQIPDNSVFCSFCGTRINNQNAGEEHKINGKMVVDQHKFEQNTRNGILVYLHDVLSMECSVNKLERALRMKYTAISIHDDGFFWKCFTLQPPFTCGNSKVNYLYLSYSPKFNQYYYAFEDVPERNIDFYDCNGNTVNHRFGRPSCRSRLLDAKTQSQLCTLPILKKSLFAEYPKILNQDSTYWKPWELRDSNWSLEPFAQVKSIIEQFGQLVKEHEQNYQRRLPGLNTEIANIEKELNGARKILTDLYGVNLIPTKYRNIGCAYFIHDFFSTSNVPLDNVFLHLDLDKIQSQLDNVINNQRDSILQQAIIISQNKEIISQNQKLFEELSDMNSNMDQSLGSISSTLNSIHASSAETSEWARIAALNAETCAWISFSNYIKGK